MMAVVTTMMPLSICGNNRPSENDQGDNSEQNIVNLHTKTSRAGPL